MAQSGQTINGLVSVARLINRATTPDRSATVKEAQQKFEAAQKAYKTAKLPDRAAEQAVSAQESLDIAVEKLAKAESAYAIAETNLANVKAATLTASQLQLLEDAVDTETERHGRAQRKVKKLEDEIKILNNEAARTKLANASKQLRAREADLKQAQDNLKNGQKATKTPEQLALLEANLEELKGNVERAKAKVAACTTAYQKANQEAQTIATDYLTLEAGLLTAEAEFERISQATAAEERFALIEQKLGKVDQFSSMGSDIKSAIALLPDPEVWWNGACLTATALVAMIYFSPLSVVLQTVTKAAKWTIDGASDVKQTVDSVWAPNLQGTPKVDEEIAGWVVTSAYGPRSAPCSGCSSNHGGVDLADPRGASHTMGKQLYAIGKPGTKVELTCWQGSGGGGLVATLKPQSMPGRKIDYLHLSKCALSTGQTKVIDAGPVIAAVGNSGHGSGPHAHIQESINGKRVAPQRGVVWWAMTGEEPQPVVAQSKVK
ncbi:MAG: hypothetical protein KME13_24260 [Myxacorys californica WJT36-NPBG1]|jgi:murein DD-endopeptidase MepM/ murein hydrolase activator NlpD|nr:hypothetical protein [Myxacorys californica WJT36-NPBG1]